ncbi:hypothetical protein ACFQ4C_19240 [Larkinella insperata]|uniref:Uncharacterized protein n=1 Tax=Larkinella insperata TaxID=332158 RepID=A0ABW3QFU9_9BACT|nr:hypothetical protein [Larkinella insperata]
MKTLSKQFTKTVGGLLTALFFLASLSVSAQSENQPGTKAAKGYWKIQTDYASRSTVVRFFNDRNEPVYQETLPGKYVKLTKRNIRLFDEMLDRVVNSQLLASQVRSSELLASNDVRFTRTTPRYELEETSSMRLSEANKTFLVKPWINSLGKLRVHFANPEQKLVSIELTDETARTVYFNDLSRLEGYNRYLDVTQMLSGKYRLQVKKAGEKMVYWLTIDKPNRQYALKFAE